MTNTADGDFYNDIWYSRYFVRVSYDGLLNWFPGGLFQANCDIDVSYFPYDQQVCHFDFENYVYSVERVKLTYTDDASDNFLKFFANDNGLWDVRDSKIVRYDKDYGFENPYPVISFYLKMQRKHLYYATNIIFLSFIIATLVLASFKLPAESGEKVSFSVTLLLSFAVYMVVIIDFLPETSKSVPLITTYLMCFCILTGITVLQSVFVLFCFHHHGEHRAPRWVSWFFLVFLSKAFCNTRVQNTVYHFNGGDEAEAKSGTSAPAKSETEKVITIREWQDISRLIDSLTFWIFLVLSVLIVVVAHVFVPYGALERNLEEQIQKDLNLF
jgi:hypothetical protein